MPITPVHRAVEIVRDAEGVREQVASALTGCGVTLPSPRVDAASCPSAVRRPLRCDVTTARRLADLLRADVTGGES